MAKEIRPPWILYPGFHPYDGVWRQNYCHDYNAWVDFWQKLPAQKRKKYLIKWRVPKEWREDCPYINLALNQLLASDDSVSDTSGSVEKPKKTLFRAMKYFARTLIIIWGIISILIGVWLMVMKLFIS